MMRYELCFHTTLIDKYADTEEIASSPYNIMQVCQETVELELLFLR